MLAYIPPARCISRTRFLEYRRALYPKLKLTRVREDECDVCERIRIQLLNKKLDDESRECLEAELREHLEPARIQRKVWSAHVLKYAKSLDTEFTVAEDIIPETTDVSLSEVGPLPDKPKVILEAHDFGGSLPLPHYGYRRPGSDYYESNLMQHNFIICDVGRQENTIMFYDQRDQGKGADACNSMRMRYYLRKLSDLRCKGLKPEKEVSLMVLMDNCTGQNKSRAVFQFFCMLSTFFQKVVLFYFITGHTKMIADRVVALWRNALKRKNFYSLDDIVARVIQSWLEIML